MVQLAGIISRLELVALFTMLGGSFTLVVLFVAGSASSFRLSPRSWTAVLRSSAADWEHEHDTSMASASEAAASLGDELLAIAKNEGQKTDWSSLHADTMGQAGDAAASFADELESLAERCQDDLADVHCELFRETSSTVEEPASSERPTTLNSAVRDLRDIGATLSKELEAMEEECFINPTMEKCEMSFFDSELSVEMGEYKGVQFK